MLICMWRVPELVTHPSPLCGRIRACIDSSLPPRVWGSALSKQLPREQLVSERGGERERGSTGESEGNQFLEKYCLSILCQELVCVVAFFVLGHSVALALWPQPPTPLQLIQQWGG